MLLKFVLVEEGLWWSSRKLPTYEAENLLEVCLSRINRALRSHSLRFINSGSSPRRAIGNEMFLFERAKTNEVYGGRMKQSGSTYKMIFFVLKMNYLSHCLFIKVVLDINFLNTFHVSWQIVNIYIKKTWNTERYIWGC